MSRIGKQPVAIPKGIEVTVDGTTITVKKGNKSATIPTHGRVDVEVVDGNVVFTRKGEDKESSAFWGTYRALTNNAIFGLDQGFKKSLEINGVGYRAAKSGKKLTLTLGYSHPVEMEDPEGIESTVEGTNKITVKGIDKEKVGQFAAEIRTKRPPEPYKGKGIKYSDERIRRKVGKTGKK